MHKLLLLLSLSLFSSLVGANERACKETKIGEYDKALWDLSLSSGLKGELFRQLNQKTFYLII